VATGATVHRLEVSLSDVDRGVYEALDLRLARHPSETMRWLFTRMLAYCLSYEEGIAFSRGGLSDTEEPPVSVRDPQGSLVAWIDVGAPSADRLHRASKAARRVAVFTTDLAAVRREASARAIHRADDVEVWRIEPGLVEALEQRIDRHAKLDLSRNDGRLYVDVGGSSIEGSIERVPLVAPP
jgi:uncharacterized protein YaeQ